MPYLFSASSRMCADNVFLWLNTGLGGCRSGACCGACKSEGARHLYTRIKSSKEGQLARTGLGTGGRKASA